MQVLSGLSMIFVAGLFILFISWPYIMFLAYRRLSGIERAMWALLEELRRLRHDTGTAIRQSVPAQENTPTAVAAVRRTVAAQEVTPTAVAAMQQGVSAQEGAPTAPPRKVSNSMFGR